MAHYQMLMPGQAFSEFDITIDMKELVDLFAPPVHLPSPLPLHVCVDADPDLRLLSAVRSLTDGPSSAMVTVDDAVSEDDVREALVDAYSMRTRFISEGRLLRELKANSAACGPQVSMATAISALDALPWPPAADPAPPHRHKRRRIHIAQPTVTVPIRSRPLEVEAHPGSGGNALPHSPPPERTSKLGRKRVLTAGQRKANHIQSEQNRRAKIREACDLLCTAVGEPPSASRSEEVVLHKTIEHVQHLLAKQAFLLQRLRDARAVRSLPISDSFGAGVDEKPKWEREWHGGEDAGAGADVDDGDGSDQSGNDE